MNKIEALAKHLGIDVSEIEESYDGDHFDADGAEYWVMTDEEADQAWEESLDNYLEECVYPELPETMRNYFNDAAWKRDAKFDGRGHSLSSYDGEENEIFDAEEKTWFYIYRTN